MVARVGRNTPAPFTIPQILTLFPLIRQLTISTFGKVSVVMIASTVSIQPSGERALINLGIPSSIFSIGRGIPITPVEEGIINVSSVPNPFAAQEEVLFASSSPRLQVHAWPSPLLWWPAR